MKKSHAQQSKIYDTVSTVNCQNNAKIRAIILDNLKSTTPKV